VVYSRLTQTIHEEGGGKMPLNLVNLDARTRSFMLQEIGRDITADILHKNKNLIPQAVEAYPLWLKKAVEEYDDSWLMQQLVGKFNATHEYTTKKGKTVVAPVSPKSAEMFAEGEFNRFYCRGLCLRAIEENVQGLVIYRAKIVETPRSESEAKIGTTVSPALLLDDLRTNIGRDTELGVPGGPLSGLSVKLP